MALSISFRKNKKAEITPQESLQQEPPVRAEAGDPLAKLRAFVADESWVKRVNRLLVEANQASSQVQQLIARRGQVERERTERLRNGSNPDEDIRQLSAQIRSAGAEAKEKKVKARELVDQKIADLSPASGGIWRAVVSKRQEVLAAVEKLQELLLGSASGVGQNLVGAEKIVRDYNQLAGGLWDAADALVSKTGGPALSIRRPEMRFTRHTGLAEEVEVFLRKFRDVLR